jgi:hypothetical protein
MNLFGIAILLACAVVGVVHFLATRHDDDNNSGSAPA